LTEFYDQNAIASFVECWAPPLEGAKGCWRGCPGKDGILASELCWGPGWAPGMECLDREVLAELVECLERGLQPQ
jgi:hypothetical protein